MRTVFDVARLKQKISGIEKQISSSGFWNNQQEAQKVIAELKGCKAIVDRIDRVRREYSSVKELLEIVEEGDEKSASEVKAEIDALDRDAGELELRNLFSGDTDRNNAILSVHAGAGGTESCDWAQMLLRMYTRWADSKGFKTELIDMLAGEEAGIRNATMIVKGEYACGYLNSEKGVHRLVRISPFDSNKRRHTSFASCDVIPEVADDVDIEINPEEIRVDTYRAGGHGGQHVNVTDSAVRITHLPTNIVVQCQNERSQFKNKAMAMKVLKARLYEKRRQEQRDKMEKEYGQKGEIAWGNQIRSYVLQPQQLIKDHRTGVEVGNSGAVLDGDIDVFITAYLKKMAGKGK